MKKFILKTNRALIDLKLFIIDLDSTQNIDNFVSTMSKILIANKYYEKNSKDSSGFESNMINFSATYDKSRRSFLFLQQLFQLVEEKNTKTITSGVFGYQERLKIFLEDKSKHSPVFESFLKNKKIELESLYELKKSDVEDLIVITSSRGVAKSGLSLKDKSYAVYRFDDLKPVCVRYDPNKNIVEPWRLRFNSDFMQLAGSIGHSKKNLNVKRCAILARASKQGESEAEDNGLVTWTDCIELFETIPSLKISEEVVFCSYNAANTIKNDSAYKKNVDKYKNRMKEVSRDDLFLEILSHTNLMQFQQEPIKLEKKEQDLINTSVNKVLKDLNHLLKEIKNEKLRFKVIWSTNSKEIIKIISL